MDIEECLKIWRTRLQNTKRKEISPGELSSLFQQRDMQQAFFNLIDQDSNGALSLAEWTMLYKINRVCFIFKITQRNSTLKSLKTS